MVPLWLILFKLSIVAIIAILNIDLVLLLECIKTKKTNPPFCCQTMDVYWWCYYL